MRYLTFFQLSQKLGGRSRSSLYRDIETGRLPTPIKLGGRRYWSEAEIDGWLKTASDPAGKTPKQDIAQSGSRTPTRSEHNKRSGK